MVTLLPCASSPTQPPGSRSPEPRLVRFQQAMPENGPQACQERLGVQSPGGDVTHQAISD